MTKEYEVVHDTGYGLIPRSIMRNKDLTYQAKAVYSYLASFAGNTGKAFPSTDLMADELAMSRNTLFRYLKELKDADVIRIERERQRDGTFTKNIYYLNNTVGKKTPCTNYPYMDNPDIDKPYVDNQYTNSNNLNSNNLNSNKSNKGGGGTIPKEQLENIISKWNDLELAKIIKLSPTTERYKMLKQRIEEYDYTSVLVAIENIKYSSFLQGKNSRGWEITFDWLVRPNNFIKVLEEQYTDLDKPTILNKKEEQGKDNPSLDIATDEDGNSLVF